MDIILQSTLTCPEYGFAREETMPTDACVYFWDCPHCDALICPKVGDCCIYCAYGTVPCPPIQLSGNKRCCN